MQIAIFVKQQRSFPCQVDAEFISLLPGVFEPDSAGEYARNGADHKRWIAHDQVKSLVADGRREVTLDAGDISQPIPTTVKIRELYRRRVEINGVNLLAMLRQKGGQESATGAEVQTGPRGAANHGICDK